MQNDCQLGHRRSIRLPDYDYTGAGTYFITICTHQRECLLGHIVGGEVQLSQFSGNSHRNRIGRVHSYA